jgi:hypothetical protein
MIVNDEVGRVWHILRYHPKIWQEELRKNTWDSWPPGQELNPDHSEYEAGLLSFTYSHVIHNHPTIPHNLCI